jgi:hypothetical protein
VHAVRDTSKLFKPVYVTIDAGVKACLLTSVAVQLVCARSAALAASTGIHCALYGYSLLLCRGIYALYQFNTLMYRAVVTSYIVRCVQFIFNHVRRSVAS